MVYHSPVLMNNDISLFILIQKHHVSSVFVYNSAGVVGFRF